MAGLLEFFFNSFVQQIKPEDDIVNIEPLIEFWTNCSPITLMYKRDTFGGEIRPAILSNLCATHQEKGIFLQYGVDALKEILSQDMNDNSVARWCLSVHFTKVNDLKGDGRKLSYLLNTVRTMTVKVPDHYDKSWIEMAEKVIKHRQIQVIVINVLQKFDIEMTPDNHIRFAIISNEASLLRGFSGLDFIYINCVHFENTFQMSYTNAAEQLHLSTERVELAAKMSLIALIVHEFGHVKLRQASGNFNISAPKLAKEKGLPDDHKELGVLCEIQTFGAHVDWSQSRFGASLDYMRSFISAIETEAELPKGPLGIVVNRFESEHFSSGVDIYTAPIYE